jgi:D-aspartate ligase
MTTTTVRKQTDRRDQRHSANVAQTTKPAAVLIGFDSMQGLPAARILAGHGVPVIGIASDPKHSQCKTNICSEIIYAPTADAELIPYLTELGKRLEKKAVLFPCEDTNVLVVSRHRQKLEEYFHVLLPASDTVEMLMDKVKFYSYANHNDLPIPKTFFIENSLELEKASRELNYPCVLKPRDSAARKWEDETIFKAFKIHDAAELIATHNHYQRYTDCFIVQEWIEGDDSDLYSCNCYFDADSNPLATFVARKIRQWPPETGVSCLGEEVRNDEVLEQTIRLFRSVNYRGLGYMEMKQDRRNGKYFIVEPNIGRPTGRGTIAEAGGVDLLYTAYCDALGLPLPENRQQTYQGVKWIHLRKDIQSAVSYWRRGELTLSDWWRSVRGKKAYAVASWRDPWPFVFDWLGAVRSSLSPSRRKKRGVKSLQSARKDKKSKSKT